MEYNACPFCGSDHIIEMLEITVEGNQHTLRCANCHCRGPVAETAMEARRLWQVGLELKHLPTIPGWEAGV